MGIYTRLHVILSIRLEPAVSTVVSLKSRFVFSFVYGMNTPIMPALISCIDLSLSGITSGVNLELEPGKTSLFTMSTEGDVTLFSQALIGELLPDNGKILFDDIPLSEASREDVYSARRSIGIVSASGGLISNLKLWENITLPLLFHQESVSDDDRKFIHYYLEKLGLSGNLWTLPGHLGLFERRIAGFIRAAVTKPRCIIYAGCFDNITKKEKSTILDLALNLHADSAGLLSVFITSGSATLDQLEPDLNCDMRRNPHLITRKQ